MKRSYLLKGFSLAELMVVISIIATLMALLFPIIGSIRQRAYATECASQLKQIGIAFRMYENDWGSYPPDIDFLAPNYLSPALLVCPWVKLNVPHDVLKRADEMCLKIRGTHWTSYFFFHQGFLDNLYRRGVNPISYSQILQIRGDATPIAYCREHREPYITVFQDFRPYWFFPEAPIVVLRRDGSVSLSYKGGTSKTGIDTLADALTL